MLYNALNNRYIGKVQREKVSLQKDCDTKDQKCVQLTANNINMTKERDHMNGRFYGYLDDGRFVGYLDNSVFLGYIANDRFYGYLENGKFAGCRFSGYLVIGRPVGYQVDGKFLKCPIVTFITEGPTRLVHGS